MGMIVLILMIVLMLFPSGDSFAASCASASSSASVGNLGVRFVNTEVPTLRAGAGSLVHRVPDVVREAPCQHHRPHGLRHRAAEVLPHRELQVRQPALRGGGHPGAVQRRGPGASQAALVWKLSTRTLRHLRPTDRLRPTLPKICEEATSGVGDKACQLRLRSASECSLESECSDSDTGYNNKASGSDTESDVEMEEPRSWARIVAAS